ncbi:hypothetical protein [Streptomyces uncialis]|uniref:hypothetical protein n=1 Tax=Streptomyces uncialis TaxID=1048205 RepID=UPI00225C2404|nr:hypothetical protein [Streptomyces uncialis]MCX4659139.1 hypothetical protein [Streptomyces uncialis]
MHTPEWEQCGFCRQRFRQRTGPGRRKDYCDPGCRRRAQRRRDAARAVRGEAVAGLRAGEAALVVGRLAGDLVELVRGGAPLADVLRVSGLLALENERVAAAAVAEHRGRGWAVIAAAAGVGERAARARWSTAAVGRLWESRNPVFGSVRQVAWRSAVGSGAEAEQRLLGRALSHAQRMSGVPVAVAARGCGLSAETVAGVLAGELVPSWAETCALAVTFGAGEGQVRSLWESAQGVRSRGWTGLADAAGGLFGFLSGLRLAAGMPDAEGLAGRAGLPVPDVGAVLSGALVPDWRTTVSLTSAMGAQGVVARPVWERMHYAFLTAPDPFSRRGAFFGQRP